MDRPIYDVISKYTFVAEGMKTTQGGLYKVFSENENACLIFFRENAYFIDFLILFCFADFFLENPSNVTKINVKCEKGAH